MRGKQKSIKTQTYPENMPKRAAKNSPAWFKKAMMVYKRKYKPDGTKKDRISFEVSRKKLIEKQKSQIVSQILAEKRSRTEPILRKAANRQFLMHAIEDVLHYRALKNPPKSEQTLKYDLYLEEAEKKYIYSN